MYIYIYISGCVHVQRNQGQPKEKINQENDKKREEDEWYRQKVRFEIGEYEYRKSYTML